MCHILVTVSVQLGLCLPDTYALVRANYALVFRSPDVYSGTQNIDCIMWHAFAFLAISDF